MPGSRRIPRSIRSISSAVGSAFNSDSCGQRYAPLGAAIPALPALEPPAAPKHFPFPNTSVDDDLFFELLMTVFTITSGGLQFLHLYRTVWWLPHSYNRQAINFYLIDPYLVMFISLILSRRLLYLVGCKVLDEMFQDNRQTCHFYYKLFLSVVMCTALASCACCILQNHQLEKILYLCYPFIIYLIFFGVKIHPFFELNSWVSVSVEAPPLHACTSNPTDIRKEVESLIKNFNYRIKEILFGTILSAYYAGFIPCCFAQPALHYDTLWATQHILFIFLSGFIAFFIQILSLRYCDILHRSALHLGVWEKPEPGRSLMLVNSSWKDDVLWPYGALVRHGRDIWRAQAECNASEPGNVGLKRFYYLFYSPMHNLGFMLLIHTLMVIYQLILLVRSNLWHNIISLTFMLFFNYYVLYKLCRDYLVSHKIYTEEREMHKKINIR